MQKWQYMTIERFFPYAAIEDNWQHIQDALNNFGIEGWELVGFGTAEREERAILIYTFKRPIE